jgi:hypothetical protein
MPPFALTDNQMHAVMLAAAPLDPSKRVTLMERVAASLRVAGIHRPSDHDVERAVQAALRGLRQG